MNSSMLKNIVREIRGTLGRFLAILAIIALGVGFFAGLKVTRPSMIETADKYLAKANLFDFRLLSSLGYTEKEVEELSELDGVEYAEGAFFADAVFSVGGEERVMKAHSLTEKLNRLSLVAGRLPESAEECVLDSRSFGEADIGKVITVAETDGESPFAFREYRVCGIASSPCYLNLERGNTKLGNGTISAFLYLLPEGFDSEVYHEVYLTLTEKAPLLSEDYDKIVDKIRDKASDKNSEVSLARYSSLKSDAEGLLASAKAEYEEGKAAYLREKEEAEEELSRTLAELDEKEETLAGQEQTLNDAISKLNAAKETLTARLEETEGQLAVLEASGATTTEAYFTLKAAREELSRTLEETDASLTEAEAGLAAVEEGKKLLAEGRESYNEAKEKAEASFAEAEEELADAEKEIADREDEISAFAEPAVYLFTRDDNAGYSCYNSDTKIVDGISRVFPVFFFLVAALVCTTTMTRMVDEGRTQIGTLKALGYRSTAIAAKYLIYSGSAALIGCVLGFFLGTWLFPLAIWKAYDILYGFAPLEYVFDPLLAALSVVVSLLCSVGATALSCRSEFTKVPAELIRPKAPKPGKRIFLERIPFFWRSLSFLRKVSLRNIFRYKRRLFMMILGIGGCSALLLTGLGLRDSISGIVSAQFDRITVYDCMVNFGESMDGEKQKAFLDQNAETLEDAVFVWQGSVDLMTEGATRSVTAVASGEEKITKFIQLHDGDTPIPAPKKGECVVDRKTAETLGVKVGDTLRVRDIDLREFSVKVSGICDNYVYSYLFLSYDTVADYDYGFRAAYVFIKEDCDQHEAAAGMMSSEGVVNVTVNRDIRERVNNMMKSLNFIVWLVIACASALAFVVLFNLSNINITERVREIATIKVLGFYPAETCAYVFRENLILTAFGVLFGMPLGVLLHRFVMSCITIDIVSFENVISPLSFLAAILLTFLFTLTVELVMRKKINAIPMAESLKSAE